MNIFNKMESIHFYKYQGTGNDFIMIDDRKQQFNENNEVLIAHLCDRRFGVGADGLILLRRHAETDFEMIYFNADGRLASLCGNGSRCAVHFANFLGIIDEKTTFKTVEGNLDAYILYGLIHLRMPDVVNIQMTGDHFLIKTGSPHYICFVDEIENLNVYEQGREIRYSKPFAKEGINVNFVKPISDSEIFVRTYERGVEDETLSCGTGVTASAIAYSLKNAKSPVNIKTPGGDLQISFRKMNDQKFTDIYLIGPAQQVFEGTILV